MNDEFLLAIQQLQQFAGAATRQEHFKKLRDSEYSEVADGFFNLLAKEDPVINKTTGVQHTVESMVSELQSRVGLDRVLNKKSTKVLPILSRKAKYDVKVGEPLSEADVLGKLEEFSKKYFLERDHGLSSAETMIEDFKMQPDGMAIIENLGREKIRDMLKGIIAKFPKDAPAGAMHAIDAFTMPSADLPSGGQSEKTNIGMSGSPGVP